jgi:hypothetical protein
LSGNCDKKWKKNLQKNQKTINNGQQKQGHVLFSLRKQKTDNGQQERICVRKENFCACVVY